MATGTTMSTRAAVLNIPLVLSWNPSSTVQRGCETLPHDETQTRGATREWIGRCGE